MNRGERDALLGAALKAAYAGVLDPVAVARARYVEGEIEVEEFEAEVDRAMREPKPRGMLDRSLFE